MSKTKKNKGSSRSQTPRHCSTVDDSRSMTKRSIEHLLFRRKNRFESRSEAFDDTTKMRSTEKLVCPIPFIIIYILPEVYIMTKINNYPGKNVEEANGIDCYGSGIFLRATRVHVLILVRVLTLLLRSSLTTLFRLFIWPNFTFLLELVAPLSQRKCLSD